MSTSTGTSSWPPARIRRSAAGSPIPYGLSWQIVPRRFTELMRDPDPAKVRAVTATTMTMQKLDVAALGRGWRDA